MQMSDRREELDVPGFPRAAHYAHVVRAGRLVFISGCTANDEQGRIVGGSDIVAQTRYVHERLKKYLAVAGATFADVCKATIFVTNIADREKVNAVRKEYFGATRPASTLIEISRLAKDDQLIEIELIAVLPG